MVVPTSRLKSWHAKSERRLWKMMLGTCAQHKSNLLERAWIGGGGREVSGQHVIRLGYGGEEHMYASIYSFTFSRSWNAFMLEGGLRSPIRPKASYLCARRES